MWKGTPLPGSGGCGLQFWAPTLALVAGTVWTGAFGGEVAEELHELLGWTLLAMVMIHVLAVIVMSRLERENLARAMVTGPKPSMRNRGDRDAKPPTLVGFAITILVVARAVYAVLQFDPQAFTLRSAESFEHRFGGSGMASPEIGERDD
jgi:cytochrome b